jgi:2-iminobutanoate/2-iminopropanoate deaminase
LIQPNPARSKDMPYAPAVRIVGACDRMFVSGVTPSPLYHFHPHVDEAHQHPNGIADQVQRAMTAAKEVLNASISCRRPVRASIRT